MEKTLKLYTYVDGVNDTPFPDAEGSPIEIGAFRYDAKRMGGAPTITASVNYPSCLDGLWTPNVYASFNGENYYLKQTPTSSYDNEDTMYKHDVELVSERIALDNVYFYDVVSGTPQEGDKPISHSANVVFFGTIEEFVGRLNASLEYARIDYSVVIDEDITSEAKMISFDNQFFSNVLQEIYNTYELPYYFVGKTIHIGYTSNVIPDVFRYGVDDALLSITKNNLNTKTVNRVTGIGSEENIPYYYPNISPKSCGVDVTTGDFEVQVVNGEALEANTNIGDVLTYLGSAPVNLGTSFFEEKSGSFSGANSWVIGEKYSWVGNENISFREKITFSVTGYYYSNGKTFSGDSSAIQHIITARMTASTSNAMYIEEVSRETKVVTSGGSVSFDIVSPSGYEGRTMYLDFEYTIVDTGDSKIGKVAYYVQGETYTGWISNGWEEALTTKQLGLSITGAPSFGDTITVVQKGYINPQRNLMPSIYRESGGDERFYNAIENRYPKSSSDSGYYEFPNPYEEGKPIEQIVEFPDIKPTIKGVLNDSGERIDEFLEFAFDWYDNNEIDEDGNYIHSHFFAKLRKLPFNLFDHAIENGEMTINMTGGSLGGCAFTIAVGEDEDGEQWNTVQVDEYGNLKRDGDGNVICGIDSQGDVAPQARQNDTINNEVWIALKKDQNYTTYARPTLDATAEDGAVKVDSGGVAISGKRGHYTPYEGTTFVITNILLPLALITDAEERLKEAILDYMEKNNDEKFSFSISFSKIYLAEQEEEFLKNLNENARIYIEYNEIQYLMYVSSYSYTMGEGDILPSISVELSDSLGVSQNALQQAISEVKGDLLSAMGNTDVLAQATPYFLRKDQKDRARKVIVFEEGLEVGDYSNGVLGSGAKISIDENGSTHVEADYLNIRKKATFTTISVQELKSVGGEIIVSPAAMVCNSVEETSDAYRCYFNTSDNEGKHIFNEFAVDDQARCQVFNVLGMRYYWRLVTAVGDNYIDLSKTDCDENSDIPQAGDVIVTLGNRTDADRQNAIIHSAYGEYAPSMTQYAGIGTTTGTSIDEETGEPIEVELNPYSLNDKIVTRFSPKGNLITGQLTIKAGSSGLEALEEWASKQEAINNAQATADGKIKVFQSTPTPPYQLGDFWATGDDAPLKMCINAKLKGESFDEDDWALADNAQSYADALFKSLEFGATNLIRNSGFTGDYTSKSLADRDVLEESSEMYSEWDAWWTVTNVTKNNDSESQSGVSVTIASGGSLVQELYNNIVVGESYMVSFRAKGTGGVTVSFGGATVSISLTSESEYVKYEAPIIPTSSSKTFTLSGTCTLCDLQLEIGNVASSWSRSFLDNFSDRAYWQSLKYLQQAIHDNSADLGGLRLGTIIAVGSDVVDEEGELSLENVTGGMNGVWNNDDSVSFWSGGTLNEAITTVSTYKNNPTYQPTDTELAAMASYVVTHGGRAILNDAILSGYIYAKGGVFNGTVYATEGEFTGTIHANEGSIGNLLIQNGSISSESGCSDVVGEYRDYAAFDEDGFRVAKTYNAGSYCASVNSVRIMSEGISLSNHSTYGNGWASVYADGFVTSFLSRNAAVGVLIGTTTVDEEDTLTDTEAGAYSIYATEGVFAGLRPNVRVVSTDDTLFDIDHTIIFTNTERITITLPSNPQKGQTYRFLRTTTSGVVIEWSGKSAINVATGGSQGSTFSARSVVLTYCEGTWYVEYITLSE